MATRQRAILVLLSLMAAMALSAYYLVSSSGSVVPEPRRAIEVAGSSKDVSLFKGEVLVWAEGGFSDAEVLRIRDSVRVAQISAVRTGFLEVAGGQTVRVRGVVDDHVLGGYEAAISAERGKPLGITRAGYALVRPRGALDTLRLSVGRLLGGRRLAFQLPSARPWFRAGNGTLPMAQLKLRFGEFAVKRLTDPVPGPSWANANLGSQAIPVLGEVRCHRLILGDLSAAMADLQRQHLAGLVDTAAFRRAGGCLAGAGATGGLSSLTWGIGLDLTAGGNAGGRADQRLVAVMARHGFTWAGRWLRPRTGHFEWVGEGA